MHSKEYNIVWHVTAIILLPARLMLTQITLHSGRVGCTCANGEKCNLAHCLCRILEGMVYAPAAAAFGPCVQLHVLKVSKLTSVSTTACMLLRSALALYNGQNDVRQ
jgi:hypothetical protein